LLTLYTFLCFTNLVPIAQHQYAIGFASCLLVLAHLVINFMLIISGNAMTSIKKLKQQYMKVKIKRRNSAKVSVGVVKPE
jgi:hypothetical protein